MKKSLLLFVAGVITMSAGAQERKVDDNNHSQTRKSINFAELQSHRHNTNAAARTTAGTGGSRWYFYGEALAVWEANYNSASSNVYSQFISPWIDTNSYVTYPAPTGVKYNSMVSMGTILAPQDTLFNDGNSFFGFGDIKVTNSTGYTVDSIILLGVYGHAAASASVDTIRLAFSFGSTSGSGVITTGGFAAGDPGAAYPGIMFADMSYDSITNIAQLYSGAPTLVQDIILDNSASGSVYSPGTPVQTIFSGPAYYDTTDATSAFGPNILGTNGGNYTGENSGLAVKLNTPIVVPAGQIVGVSLTYFSGRPSPPALTGVGVGGSQLASIDAAGDVTYNYNSYQPLIEFASDGADNPAFVPFSAGIPTSVLNNPYTGSNQNNNTGLFKELPNYENNWDDVYLPNWAWYTPDGPSEGPSEIQYPFIVLHVNCSSCDTIPHIHTAGINTTTTDNTVNAYPNPATNELNIAFNMAQASAVTITLTNMVGEVVATQNMGTVSTGKAVFSTANLADGIYIYTLTANGTRTSAGHVAVSH